jgi:hypothetical protein
MPGSGGKSVNPALVACLIASVLVGASAAGIVLAFGWGLLLAFLAYSLCGSGALVAITLIVLPGEARRPHPVPVLAPPARRKAPALA